MTARRDKNSILHEAATGRVSVDFQRGQRDGLRLALALLSAEEAKWAALLGKSRSGRTNVLRGARHKTLEVAQKRIRTILGRLSPNGDGAIDVELAAALGRLGL